MTLFWLGEYRGGSGSAHVSCAGDGVSPSRTLRNAGAVRDAQILAKFVAVEHGDQHARRVRYPEPGAPHPEFNHA